MDEITKVAATYEVKTPDGTCLIVADEFFLDSKGFLVMHLDSQIVAMFTIWYSAIKLKG